MAVIEATDKNFDELIQSDYAIVDFYGDHCGACVSMSPFFRDAANDYAFISFIKMNTSNYKDFVEHFEIRALPTIMIYKRGKMVKRTTGGMDREMIDAAVSKMLYD